MKGSTFLAVALIVIGLVFLVAVFRGRAPQLYEAIGASFLSSGQTGGRVSQRPITRQPRRSAP